LVSEKALPSFDEVKGELVGEEGEDYVIIAAEALRRINKQEEMMFGTGSFLIWYNSGKAVGRTDGRGFAPLMETVEINELASRIKDIYMKRGWGEVTLGRIELATGELYFQVRNSPLVRGLTSKEPRCWFVRGFVEGLTSELLGIEVTASEIACQAVNGDHCEYRLRWDMGISP
jgi:predicted hydrocarbon binding protein